MLYGRTIVVGLADDYNSMSLLGSGAFGNVYKSTCMEDGKDYAVKSILKEKLIHDEDIRQAMVNEVNVLKRVQDESIIKLHRLYEDEEKVYLVTDLC
jgi:calcium/calmodulin-dependent protein kinase I